VHLKQSPLSDTCTPFSPCPLDSPCGGSFNCTTPFSPCPLDSPCGGFFNCTHQNLAVSSVLPHPPQWMVSPWSCPQDLSDLPTYLSSLPLPNLGLHAPCLTRIAVTASQAFPPLQFPFTPHHMLLSQLFTSMPSLRPSTDTLLQWSMFPEACVPPCHILLPGSRSIVKVSSVPVKYWAIPNSDLCPPPPPLPGICIPLNFTWVIPT
jgi:hypothetical protein